MTEPIKLTAVDIAVVIDKNVGFNENYQWNVKFLSLEGNDIVWRQQGALQLKQQILDNQEKAEKLEKIRQLLKSQTIEGDIAFRRYLIIKQLKEILGDK